MVIIIIIFWGQERAIKKAKEQLELEQTASQGEEDVRDKDDQQLEENAVNIRHHPNETPSS